MIDRLRPMAALAALLLWTVVPAAQAADPTAAPLAGPTEPRVAPQKGDDGIYHQQWFAQSFLDLKEDLGEARAQGKRLAIVFEQRGCIWCRKMHTEVLALRYINDYVSGNFHVLQLDLRGAREVTDFDGTRLSERQLAERWQVPGTPTIVFFREDLAGLEGRWGADLEVGRTHLGNPGAFYDMFVWVRTKAYESEPSAQHFHLARQAERAKEGTTNGKSN